MRSSIGTQVWGSELMGTRRLALVGREQERSEIQSLYRKVDHHTLIYWEGDGGIGKTALLEYAIQQAKEFEDIIVIDLIDLYHIEFQTPIGLAKAIVNGLGKYHFKKYLQKERELRDKARAGEEITQQWEQAWEIFVQELATFTRRHKTMIALDTVEVLQYDNIEDPFQQYAQQNLPLASVGQWLLEKILPRLENESFLLWLWAGRPTQLGLRLGGAQRNLDLKFRTLKPLKEEDAIAYLQTIAKEIDQDDPHGAQWIQDHVNIYPQEVYASTLGRPILLAMVADILRVGGQPPTHFSISKSEGVNENTMRERSFIQHLLNLETPIGETLQVMGQLRKGVDAILLSQLLEIDQEDAQSRLEAISRLALVKHRPQGKRPYFLHDELYDLLERYSYQSRPRQEADTQKIFAYYNKEESTVLKKLQQDSLLRERWESERQALQVEQLHYRLRDSLDAGFSEYFLRAEDALDSRDWELDMLLRAELLRTLSELERVGHTISDLRKDVELDAAVRWAARSLWLYSDVENASKLLNKIRQWRRDRTNRFDDPLRWYWELYAAILDMKQLQYSESRKKLERIDDALRKLSSDNQSHVIVKVLRAFTGAYQGYLDRLQGRYYQAVEHYQQATIHFRSLKMGSLISALSNQAFAMAQVGHFRHARLVLQEAYERATEENQSYWQAHVLNVRALVETMDGHSRTGLRYVEDALEILTGPAQNERLKGLALLTRSKALRYLWNDYVTEKRWRKEGIEESLWPAYNALEGSDHGLQLLKKQGGLAYVTEGLIESGCIFRGMAWAHRRFAERPPLLSEEQLNVFKNADRLAEERLLNAAGIIESEKPWESQLNGQKIKLGGDPYLPALAIVNLAWHYHYQRRTTTDQEKLDRITERIELVNRCIKRIIPHEYHLPEVSIERENAHILLWSVLGKIEMLHVHEMFWNWDTLTKDQKEEHLAAAVKHATYSLEYDHLMGDVSFDLRRAEEGLHYRLLQLNDWQDFVLPRLYKYGDQAATDFEELVDKDHTTFQRWLFETFGKSVEEEGNNP